MATHRFSLVPAAYLLLLRGADDWTDTEVLLQLRQNTGYMDGHWAAAAAGHVEEGESVIDCAVRESAEELGIRVDPGDLEPLTAMHRTTIGEGPLEQRVDFFFTSRRWSGEPAIAEPGKNGGLRWCALNALPDLVPPHERMVLDLLAHGPVPPITTFGFDAGQAIAPYLKEHE